MQLSEFIKDLDPEEWLYIAAESGRAFTVISQKKTLPESIRLEFDRLDKTHTMRISKNKYFAKTLNTKIQQLEESVANCDDPKVKSNLEQEIKICERKINKTMLSTMRRLAAKQFIQDINNFMSCEVIDSYPRRWVKPLGTIVVIDCDEVAGGYWTLEEFKRGSYEDENEES